MRLPHFHYYLQAFYAFLFSQKYQRILGTFHKKKCVFASSQSIFFFSEHNFGKETGSPPGNTKMSHRPGCHPVYIMYLIFKIETKVKVYSFHAGIKSALNCSTRHTFNQITVKYQIDCQNRKNTEHRTCNQYVVVVAVRGQ